MTTKGYVLFVLGTGGFAWLLDRQGHGELGLLLFGLSMAFLMIVALAVERVVHGVTHELKAVRELLQELVDDPALKRRKHKQQMEWLHELQRLEALKRGGHHVSDSEMDDAYCRAHGLSREAAQKYKEDMHAHRREQQLKEQQQ